MGLQEDLIAALDAERVSHGQRRAARHGTDEGWHHARRAGHRRLSARHRGGRGGGTRCARAHGTPIVPFGAGTSLEGHVAALQRRRLARHDAR